MTGFSLKEIANRFRSGIYQHSDLALAIGNINSPLLDMPLKNSLAMKAGVGSATFTRASTATYIDRYGVLKTAAIDEPRFEKEGYLNEGASTNLLTYSEQFDNAIWTKIRTTVSANTTDTLDPYGTNLAEKIVDSTDASTHYFSQVASVVAGTLYTISIFVKKKDTRCIRLSFGSLNGTFANESITFDPSDGTYLLTIGTPSVKVDSFSNGWYRVSVTATALVAATAQLFFYITLDKISSASYTGDGTSGLYIFGAQLEAMPFATSYIPTTTSAVTRSADKLLVTLNGNIPNVVDNPNGFNWSVDFDRIGTATNVQNIFGVYSSSGGTTGIYCYLFSNASSLRTYLTNSNGTIVCYASRAPAIGEKVRFNSHLSNGSIKNYLNGVIGGSYTNTTGKLCNTTPLQIGIGVVESTGGNPLNGHISNVRIWQEALTAQEVALA